MSDHCAGDECHAEQCNCECAACENATLRAERDAALADFARVRDQLKSASRIVSLTDAIVTEALAWAKTREGEPLLHREEEALLEAVRAYKRR